MASGFFDIIRTGLGWWSVPFIPATVSEYYTLVGTEQDHQEIIGANTVHQKIRGTENLHQTLVGA